MREHPHLSPYFFLLPSYETGTKERSNTPADLNGFLVEKRTELRDIKDILQQYQ